MQSMETSKDMNGLDLKDLTDTVRAIEADPSLGRFEFRNDNRWVSGGENRSTIKGFYGAGEEDTSRSEAFVCTNGEPPVLLGKNEGANPAEFVLHALAGCVTTTTVLHAAARGIRINEMSTRLVGGVDVQGLLDLDDNVFPGYESITMEVSIDADASDEEIDELLAFASQRSPVASTVKNPIPFEVKRV